MRFWIIALLMMVVIACAARDQTSALLPIDHAGVPGRWRRACELGKVGSIEACAKNPQLDEWDKADGAEKTADGAFVDDPATAAAPGAPTDDAAVNASLDGRVGTSDGGAVASPEAAATASEAAVAPNDSDAHDRP